MNTVLKPILFAICASLLATSVSAQTETTEPEAEQPAAVELSLGEAVTEGPQVGQRYIAETNGAWNIRCLKVAEGADPCQLHQPLRDQNGVLVAEFTMNPLPGTGQVRAGGDFIAPLETMLTQQVTIGVDDGQARRYPFAFCAQIGCVARIGLTAEDIAAYKAGVSAQIVIVPFAAPDSPVNLTLSLSGFTASYDKMTVN